MKRLFAVVVVTALSSGSVRGQAPAPRPAFDVAGIQINTRPQPGMHGGQLRGTRYEIRDATMVDLIRTAYNVQPEKISGPMGQGGTPSGVPSVPTISQVRSAFSFPSAAVPDQ